MRTRLVLAFAAALISNLGHSQDEAQLKKALLEGKAALSQPEKIPAAAQKIQDFFSNPKNKPLFETPEAKELANLQQRLASYLRLAQTLGRTSCNIDPTKQSNLALEILSTTLATPQCSETAPEFFQEHKKVSSLIEEKSIVEEGWYTGEYAISDEGKIVYPWELSGEDLRKYNWKSVIEPLDLTAGAKGEKTKTFDPPTSEFVDELYRQSLVDTFKTYMHLQTVYGSPKVNIPALVDKFCTKTKTFKKDYECPKGMETFLAREANQALKESKPKSHDSATKELNGKIVKLNALRAKLDKNTTYLPKSGIGKLLTPRWVDEAQAKKDYAEYAKIYRGMISSGPGLFVATDELSHDLRMKDFSPMSFTLTPKTYPTINTKRFKKAVEEAQELTFDHAQELLTIYHKKKPADEKLKNILKLNPAAASSVLLNRPEFAEKTCGALKKISIDEMNDEQLRLVTTWGGTIVGGALLFTGVFSGVGASMVGLGTAGSVAMVPEMVVNYDQLQQASNERDAAIAAQNGEKAQEKAVEYKQEKTNFTALTVLSGATILADVHMGMRAGKVVSEAMDMDLNAILKTTHRVPVDEVLHLSQAKQIERVRELGSIRINPASLVGKFDERVITKVADELIEIIRTSKDVKVQKEAIAALRKYTQMVADVVPADNGVMNSITAAYKNIYADYKLSDEVRLALMKDLDYFYGGKTTFKPSAVALAEEEAIIKKLDIKDKLELESFSKSSKTSRQTMGKPIEEFAKDNGYIKVEKGSSSYVTDRFLHSQGRKTLVGEDALVRFKIDGKTYELKGVLENTYPAGLDIRTPDGVLHTLRERFGSYNVKFTDIDGLYIIDKNPTNILMGSSDDVERIASKIRSIQNSDIPAAEQFKLIEEQLVEMNRTLDGVSEKIVKLPDSDGTLDSIRRLREGFKDELLKVTPAPAGLAGEVLDYQTFNKTARAISSDEIVRLPVTEQVERIRKIESMRMNPEAVKGLQDSEAVGEHLYEPFKKLTIILDSTKDPVVQKATLDAMRNYSKTAILDGKNLGVESRIKDTYSILYKQYHLPDDVRLTLMKDMDQVHGTQTTFKPSAVALAEQQAEAEARIAAKALTRENFEKSTLTSQKSMGKPMSEYAKENNFLELEIDDLGFIKNSTKGDFVGEEVLVRYRADGKVFELKGVIEEKLPKGLKVRTSDGIVHTVSDDLGMIQEAYIQRPKIQDLSKRLDASQTEAKSLIKETRSNMDKDIPIEPKIKKSLENLETTLRDDLWDLQENLRVLKERNLASPTPQGLTVEKALETKVNSYMDTLNEVNRLNFNMDP